MTETLTIPALEMVERAASDEKLMKKQRMQAVKVFFNKPLVKQILLQHLAITKDVCAPALQKTAIIQIANQCKPGTSVNLRELEGVVVVEGVNPNFVREKLIPALQRAGLFVPKPNGANGWLWAELPVPSLLDTAKQIMSKAAGLATSEQPDLVEEQRKLAVEQRLHEVAHKRLLLAKQNAKLIAEATRLQIEHEAELLKHPIRPVGRANPNQPALIAAGIAALVLGALLLQHHRLAREAVLIQQATAATAEPAPDYNSLTEEDILRLQIGERFNQLPAATRQNLMNELKQQRITMLAQENR